MNKTTLIALLVLSASVYGFNKDEALSDPFIRTFETETGIKLKGALETAHKNKHWQRANMMIYHETYTKKYGKNEVKSADVKGAVKEFIAAGKEGILLASWQGLNLSKLLSPMGGRWRDSVMPELAKQLADANICQGYLDLAYYQAKGWKGSRGDFKKARDLLEKGRNACSRPGAQSWQLDQWNRTFYKYDALVRYPGVLRYTGGD